MPPRHHTTAIVPARVSRWNENAARSFLDEARHKKASGTGMSDRSLERMAILAEPEASGSRTTFRHALRRVGWTERRIERAIQSVQPPRARYSIQFGPEIAPQGWNLTRFVITVCLLVAVFFGPHAIAIPAALFIVIAYYVRGSHSRNKS